MEANAESVELCSPIMAHVWLEPSLWPAGVEGARILAPLGRAVDVAPSRVGGMRGERHRQPKRVAEEVQGGGRRGANPGMARRWAQIYQSRAVRLGKVVLRRCSPLCNWRGV